MPVYNSTLSDAKKYFNAAEKLKQEIVKSKTNVCVRGKAYYISSDGDDENDGLSPESAWRTPDRLRKAKLEHGDGVFFRRGDSFRSTLLPGAWSSIVTVSGVTYSAYGEGAKPVLNNSIDVGDSAKWKQTEYENVWECTEHISQSDADIGCIIFNGGEAWGIKVSSNREKQTRMYIGKTFNGICKNDAPEEPLVLPHNVKRELEFHHSPENDTLYLYCSLGNPGDRFKSIELAPRRHCFWGDASDVLIDNIEIYGAGGHGISTANSVRYTVQNCVFRFIGGSIQSKKYTGDPIRYGNSVENWSRARNLTIHHCVSSQIYDCCWTIQWCGVSDDGDKLFENIHFHHNYTEYANNGLEVWNGPNENNDKSLRFEINGLDLHDNYTLYSGYGWSHQRPNKDANFFYGGLPKKTRTVFKNSNIHHNVNLFATCYVTFASQVGQKLFNFHNNVYFMESDKRFGLIPIDRDSCEGEQAFVPYSAEALEELMRDGVERDSEFHILPAGTVVPSFE